MNQPPIDDEAPERESIAALCARLAEDAKFLARAEVGRIRAVIFRRIIKGRMAIFYMVGAALLGQSAVLILLIGLLLFLRNHVGIVYATAIVTLTALAVSALLGWLAFSRVRHALSKEDDLL
ncbi:hypothetical protein EAH87_02610 [Sphingomonas koreensis]|nr:hypothetical protein EAH87_02610 [Sphingomonas koreensis]